MVYSGNVDFKLPIVSPYRLDDERRTEFLAALEAITRTGLYRTDGGWARRVALLVAAELRLPPDWTVVPTRSGTDALVMALMMAGVQPGGHVAAPDLAYHAVGAAITQIGAVPRWIDVDPLTLNMDVGHLAAALGREPLAAVVAVDNYGTPCDRTGIATESAVHGVPFVLDSCESLGAPAGEGNHVARADFVAVSFSFTKPIHAAGMGGALCVPEQVAAEHAAEPGLLMHPRRLPELNAAYLALAWPDLKAVVDKLRRIYDTYRERLLASSLSGLDDEGTGNRMHAPFLLPAGSTRNDRDRLIKRLARSGFEARPYFASQAMLWGMPPSVHSAEVSQRVLCLPTGAGFPEEFLDDVAAELVRNLRAGGP